MIHLIRIADYNTNDWTYIYFFITDKTLNIKTLLKIIKFLLYIHNLLLL